MCILENDRDPGEASTHARDRERERERERERKEARQDVRGTIIVIVVPFTTYPYAKPGGGKGGRRRGGASHHFER